MARTPVTEEVAEDRPKREPVLIEDEENSSTSIVERKPILVKPIDEDGYRECARPGCEALFAPASSTKYKGDATEYYCSTQCATIEFYRKQGMGIAPDLRARVERRSESVVEKQERIVKKADHEDKYGSLRNIVETLSRTAHGQRVKLECGHECSAGSAAKRARCRKCKKGATDGATLPDVPVRKRQPVSADDVGDSSIQQRRPAGRGKSAAHETRTRSAHGKTPARQIARVTKRRKKGRK